MMAISGWSPVRARANRYAMRGVLTGLFLILAVLLSSMDVAALAHVHDGNAAQVIDMLDSDHHAIDLSDDGDDAEPDGKGEIAQHHHCNVGLADGAAAICGQALVGQLDPFPPLASAMPSLTGAPPTEPPSA